jgi:hypothetical protein
LKNFAQQVVGGVQADLFFAGLDAEARASVDGTLRVLRAAAASGTVRRVVMTSSIDAIARGYDRTDTHVRTESDWSNPERSAAYAKKKFYAERAAWEFVASERPTTRVRGHQSRRGPLLHAERPTSLGVIRLLMAGGLPAVPRVSLPWPTFMMSCARIGSPWRYPHAAGKRLHCRARDLTPLSGWHWGSRKGQLGQSAAGAGLDHAPGCRVHPVSRGKPGALPRGTRPWR